MFHWPGTDRAIQRAFKEATAGNLDDAVTILRRAARASDPQGKRLEAMGMLLYQAGRWSDAADVFSRTLKAQPNNMLRLFYYASAASRAGDWDNALRVIEETAAANRTDVAPPSARCLILLERPDIPAAIAAYQQAKQLFDVYPAQDAYSMGLLEQCAESVSSLPRNQNEK